jgi:hypothetical protein
MLREWRRPHWPLPRRGSVFRGFHGITLIRNEANIRAGNAGSAERVARNQYARTHATYAVRQRKLTVSRRKAFRCARISYPCVIVIATTTRNIDNC